MNPFEVGSRKVIPAVLVYVRRGNHILMLHRNAPGDRGQADYHRGKWNGVGGKFEADESPLECAQRELLEETGLKLKSEDFKSLGVLQFPNFKAHKNEDWMVFVFSARVPDQKKYSKDRPVELKDCAEGTLEWIPKDQVLDLNLWEGDRHFIPHVLSEQPFMGTIWYDGQTVKQHQINLF